MKSLKQKIFVSNHQHLMLGHNFEGVTEYLFTNQGKNLKFDG